LRHRQPVPTIDGMFLQTKCIGVRQQLLAAIRDFQPVTKASILARLRAGARSIYN
jgi:hypothetical protein